MRETLLWHLKRLSEFYAMKLNCPNCKYSASLGYWVSDKKEIDQLINQIQNGGQLILIPSKIDRKNKSEVKQL